MTNTNAPNTTDDPALGVVVCYDGWWWHNVTRYLRHNLDGQLSFAGLHDVIRWHIARCSGHPVQCVVISEAHYVLGNCQPLPWAQEFASLGIIRHEVPVTPQKGEIGADVELALTCYQAASTRGTYAVALMSGDGDLGPLAVRIKELGRQLLVPVTDFSFSSDSGTITSRTSNLLLRHATSAPRLVELIGLAALPDYPADLRQPLITSAYQEGDRRQGTVTVWYSQHGYGYLICGEGMTWFAHTNAIQGRSSLRRGETVTFTGKPITPPGKNYPQARDIRATTALSGLAQDKASRW